MFSFNPVSLASTMAFGPMGGIVSQLATQVFSSMGQQLIQSFGKQLNLPQSEIDFAQSRFAGNIGDFGGSSKNFMEAIHDLGTHFNASHTDIADAQRKAQEDLQGVLNDLAKDSKTREAEHGRGKGGHGAQGKGGSQGSSGSSGSSSSSSGSSVSDAPGWLQAMADVLGKKLDDLAHNMQDLAGKVNKEDPSTSTNFTVASQQFNMLMDATSTALKTIGESMGKMAARQ